MDNIAIIPLNLLNSYLDGQISYDVLMELITLYQTFL